MLISYF